MPITMSNIGIMSPSTGVVVVGPATPTLIQHVTSSANVVGLGITGNNFAFQIPSPVGAGNCLVLGITYPNGNTVTSISDSVNGTWPAAAVTADAGAGNYIARIYVLPNAGAGQTLVTVTFNAAVIPFQYAISEFNNIATSSPTNGTHFVTSVSAPSLAAGSFTPTTNNDANGGNLIWSYFAPASNISGTIPTNWVPGGSFVLLDGDISWEGRPGFPHATQYFIQTAQTAINPAVTATAGTDQYNCIAIALKIATGGTAKPAGIHIDKILHFSNDSPPAAWKSKIPSVGNLRVITCTVNSLTSVVDSEGNTWNLVTTVGSANLAYWPNAVPNANLTVTVNQGAGTTNSIRFYDISGAAVSPFDTSGTNTETVDGLTTATDQPIITPTAANELIIAVLQIGQGPGLAITSPTGAIFDLVTYTGETDFDQMENADGNGHLYTTSGGSALHWNWTITNIASNSVSSVAAAFKKA